METTIKNVSQYDYNLYQQAIAKAKKQYRQDKDYAKYQKACENAYRRLNESPDTETK